MREAIEDILYLWDSMPDDLRVIILEQYPQFNLAIEELREYDNR